MYDDETPILESLMVERAPHAFGIKTIASVWPWPTGYSYGELWDTVLSGLTTADVGDALIADTSLFAGI